MNAKMNRLRSVTAIVVGFLVAHSLVGCAVVPEEAVTLSVNISNDLEEVRRSHRELAIRYFERSRVDVNRFIDDVYRPAFVKRALTETPYDYVDGEDKLELTFLPLLKAEITRQDAGEEGADPLSYLHVVVDEAVRIIEQTRLELLQPIAAREQEVLRAIDDAYSNMMNAHAIVTGHLASIRRVQQAQEELLADVGLADIRGKFVDRAAELSDRASDILAKTRKADSTLDELEEKIDEIENVWKEAIE